MRQKVTLDSSSSSSSMKQGPTVLNNGIIDKGIPAKQKNHDVPCGESMRPDSVDIVNKKRSINQRSGSSSSLVDIINQEELSKQTPNIKMMGIPSFVKLDDGCITDKCEMNDRKEHYWEKTCEESGKSFLGRSKVNENINSAGPLRYALHLRFICPFPKKITRSVQKSRPTSLPEKTGLFMEGERRFYLYNDLKVVFPQRHSDADEGKVCDYIVALPRYAFVYIYIFIPY